MASRLHFAFGSCHHWSQIETRYFQKYGRTGRGGRTNPVMEFDVLLSPCLVKRRSKPCAIHGILICYVQCSKRFQSHHNLH